MQMLRLDPRLKRLEAQAARAEQARESALADAAVRLLSDADLTAMAAWLDTPEAKKGHQEPAHLTAAWARALEAAVEAAGPKGRGADEP